MKPTQEMIDLYFSKFSDSDSFASQLYRLIAKADLDNRERLREGFPNHVAAWEMWYNSENEREFFRSYGFDC